MDKTTNNYLEINNLLKNKEYDKAQKILNGYLKNEIKEASETKGMLKIVSEQHRILESTNKTVCKTIDSQIEKIEAGLK